jgi:hypothetical protein
MITIEQVAERVAALEAAQCKCTSCREHAKDREEDAFAAEASALRAMSLGERVAALQSLNYVRFPRIARYLARDVIMETAVAAPEDLRARLMAQTDQYVRDRVAAELLAIEGRLPQWLQIENATRMPGRFPERTTVVTPATAHALRATGLRVHSEALESGERHRFVRPSIDYRRFWTVPQWSALLAADEVMRDALASREITVTELPHEQNVQRWIDGEQERRSMPTSHHVGGRGIVAR